MKFISADGYAPAGTQIHATFQPFEVASPGASIGILALNELSRVWVSSPETEVCLLTAINLTLSKGVLGKRQSNVLPFHHHPHVK